MKTATLCLSFFLVVIGGAFILRNHADPVSLVFGGGGVVLGAICLGYAVRHGHDE